MDSVPQRECKHCKQPYDLTDENFYTFKNRQGDLSFRHTCKSCFDENSKKNYRQRLDNDPDYERKRYRRRMETEGDHIREVSRARYWRDPEEYNAYQQEYRDNNREKIRRQAREGAKRRRTDDPERHYAYAKLYRENNRELYRLASRRQYKKNRQRYLEYSRTHRQSAAYRAPYNKAAKSKRRALLAQADGSYTAKELRELLEWQDYKCLYCGADLHNQYSADHYYPLNSDIKDNSIHNIVLACISCNSRKQDKLPFLFDNRCL